ncbi:MAG: sigma-70 family RNA polymerase sigma factor [Planctomycetota bacterium]|nr:sigma-70 family RNA polymerase sigma factor [Planctomycetota bacterium]
MEPAEDWTSLRPGPVNLSLLPSLSTTPTSWTTITDAHTPGPHREAAMGELISRYHDVVERYLRVKLRDQHLADEILQEFFIKLLNGKLAGADPNKGRFRDYLRTVLHRLIVDHFRTKKLQPLPPGDLLDPSESDIEFDRVWREAVLKRVWSRLETFEARTPKNRYFTVLKLRVADADAAIENLAKRLGEKQGVEVSPEAFRKTLQRARGKFFEFLVEELRSTLHPSGPEDIEAEIFDFGLGNLYRRYISEASA